MGKDGFELNFEKNEDDGSLVFYLRNDVRAAVKAESDTKVHVTLWLAGAELETLTPPDIGNIRSASFRRRLTREAARRFGKNFDAETDTGKRRQQIIEDDLGQVALALDRRPEGEQAAPDMTLMEILRGLGGGPSVAERLLKYALGDYATYFHDAEGEAYATVDVEGHRETWPLKSRSYMRWLRYRFYCEEKTDDDVEPPPLKDQVVGDVVRQLEAKAQFEGEEHAVNIRVAEIDGKVYVDLCDAAWRAVEVSAGGWRVVHDPPVKFVRAKGMAPLPFPVGGGDASILRGLLNLKDDDEGDQAWRLILAWLVKALRARGPYPVLTLLGGQGTAKSTAARILRSLVDPSTVPLRSPPKNEHDLVIDSVSSWMIAFDNISELPGWLSDAICRLSAGGGYATRTLYTDRDQELFEAMRPVVLNGITDVATRPDLLDRALIINLRPIERASRREEREVFTELEAARPKIMGFLFDAISEGLCALPNVKLEGLPRMADFARWSVATEQALGGSAGAFMEAYGASQEEAVGQALEASPVAAPLWKFARLYKGPGNAWTGSATDLLEELAQRVDDDVKRAKGWPRAAHALSRELKRLAPPLRDVGVYAEALPRTGAKGSRGWRVFYSPLEGVADKASEASEASEEGQSPHRNGDSATDANQSNSVSGQGNSVRSENPIPTRIRDATDATDGTDAISRPPLADETDEDEDWGEV